MGLEDMTLLMRIYDGIKKIDDGLELMLDGSHRAGGLDDALWIETFIMQYSIFDEQVDEDVAAFLEIATNRNIPREQRAKILLGIK